jgi:tol-pal system protein YbgF
MRRDIAQLRQEMATLAKTNEASRAFTEERLTRLETDLRTRYESSVQESQGSRTALSSRLDDTATEMRMIQGKLEEGAFALRNLGTRVDEMDQRAGLVLRRLDSLEQQVRSVDQQVRGMDAPVKSLDEQVKALDQQVKALDQQVRGPTQPPVPAPAPSPGPSPGATPGAPLPTPPPASVPGGLPPAQPPMTAPPPPPAPQAMLPPEDVYKNALADYTKGNYEQAIGGFRTYLQNYPKTSLAANAQYWLGESYYSQRNYAKAVEEFEVVIRDFAESPKVPSALFKQGDALLQLGETRRGNDVLCELLTKHPRTREARLARERNVRCR